MVAQGFRKVTKQRAFGGFCFALRCYFLVSCRKCESSFFFFGCHQKLLLGEQTLTFSKHILVLLAKNMYGSFLFRHQKAAVEIKTIVVLGKNKQEEMSLSFSPSEKSLSAFVSFHFCIFFLFENSL